MTAVASPAATRTKPDPLEGQFETICELLYATAGIALNESKRELVHSRLTRRLRQVGGSSISEYVQHVQTPEGQSELAQMVDVLTTNKTSFFRESAHFEYLTRWLGEHGRSEEPITVWSAGCSTGEEPYTLAMVLSEATRYLEGSARILATDISGTVLDKARAGEYHQDQVEPVPAHLKKRFVIKGSKPGSAKVTDGLKKMVRFGRLNLMGPWPMHGPFDAIFCRNVMIYFDSATRAELVARFEQILAPGGHLFVGHSESLTTLSHGLRYVQPAIYRKEGR